MTSATVRVEKATSDLLIAPDWTLNIDICDSANSDYGQAKDVIKAVKKRLHHKSPKVQFLTLTLLETLMKNCGDYVHQQVSEREILQDMVKIVKKKPDNQVRDKILILLDSWQEAFGGPHGKFPQYYMAYADLKGTGVVFPERSFDDAPIITPPATYPSASSFPLPRPPPQAMYIPQPGFGSPRSGFQRPSFGFPPQQPGFGIPHQPPGFGMQQQQQPGFGIPYPQPGFGMPVNASVRLDQAMASDRVDLGLSELDSMRSVMELLSDMLKAVNPTDPEAVKDEIISELVTQCRANEKKLMAFITSTGDEQLLEQSLELNDKLQSLLSKHDSIASGSGVRDQTRDPPAVSDVIAPPVPSTSGPPVPSTSAPPVLSTSAPPVPSTSGPPLSFSSAPPVPSTSMPPVPSTLMPPVAVTSGADEDEEEDDEFAQLARRSSRMMAPSSTNGSGSVPNNPLSLPDPPGPIKTSPNKEEDIINLLNLSLTLSPPIQNQNSNPSQIQIQNSSPMTSPTFQATSTPPYQIQNPNPNQIHYQNQIQNQNQYQNPSQITSLTFQATSPPPYQIQNPNPNQIQHPNPNQIQYQNEYQNPSQIASPTFQATSPVINPHQAYPIQNPNQIQTPNQIQHQNQYQTTRPIINSPPSYPIQNPNPNIPNPTASPAIQTIKAPWDPQETATSADQIPPPVTENSYALQWAPQETSSASANQISPAGQWAPQETSSAAANQNSPAGQWAPPEPSSSAYPPPPWASEPDPAQNSNSAPPMIYNHASNAPQPPMQYNMNALGAPPRPSYVSSSTFFGDLAVLRNPDGSLRSSARK